MEQREEVLFTDTMLAEFRDWLSLPLPILTWQGRYTREFEEMWTIFFTPHTKLSTLIERFDYAQIKLTTGPLRTWFKWIKDRLIIYTFLSQTIEFYTLSQLAKIPLMELGSLLRDYFLQFSPERESDFNEHFLTSNVLSPIIYANFQTLKDRGIVPQKNYLAPAIFNSSLDLEVTLYKEWTIFFRLCQQHFSNELFSMDQLMQVENRKKLLKHVRDILILVTLALGLSYGIIFLNKFHEKKLVQKITILRPKIEWLDAQKRYTDLSSKGLLGVQDAITPEELEEMDTAFKNATTSLDEASFTTESEINVNPLDGTPDSIDGAEAKRSDYEEKVNNYRDSVGASHKIYRIQIKTHDEHAAKNQVDQLIAKYNLSQVGQVAPGTEVPGGIYYNLYIPTAELKNFLSETDDFEGADVVESRAPVPTPAGKSRLFIWIKKN